MIATALSAMIPGLKTTDYGPLSSFWYQPVGSVSSSGIAVKPDNAQTVPAVYGCMRVRREVFASLPCRVYRMVEDDRSEQARQHPLWRVLHKRPNSWQTPYDFQAMAADHLVLRGNFYCKIVNTRDGLELIPLNPDRVTVEQLDDYSLRYKYRKTNGDVQTIAQDGMFHVRAQSLNGITGVSVIEAAKHTVGSSLAKRNFGDSLFSNGGLPTFWISRPAERPWGKDGTARKNFREGWRRLQGGPENAGNPPILEDGMELHKLGLTSRDSQWIEARGFDAREICRFFGVDPVLIAEASTGTLGTNEQVWTHFAKSTLMPMAIAWNQAVYRDLIDDEDYYVKLVLDSILSADLLSRYQANNIAVQGGWKLVNEVRRQEDMNPIEGGDTPRYPLNMQPAGGGPDQNEQGGQPGKGEPKPPKQVDDEGDEETAYEKRKKQQKSQQEAFGILLEEAAQRIAAHEIRGLGARADKAAEDREKWNAWGADFYCKHLEYAAKTLDPICAAWLAENGVKLDPKLVAARLQEPANTAELFEQNGNVPAILDRWRSDLAAHHTDTLTTEFFRCND